MIFFENEDRIVNIINFMLKEEKKVEQEFQN